MAKSNHLRMLSVLAALMVALIVAVLVARAPASAQGARDTLKQPPFPPTDTSLFSPVIYDGPPLVPAAEAPSSERAMKKQLGALMKKRFGKKSKKVKKALALFSSSKAKAKVSDPRLRAALVSLKGTVGEPGISGVLGGPFSGVRFIPASEMVSATILAQVSISPSGVPEILFNLRYQHEDFRLLAPTMAHESLHQDGSVGGHEELIATSIDSLIYGQFLLESPMLAASGTEPARRQNTKHMARINTRDTNGNVRLLEGNGNVYPGGNKELPYFAAAFNLDEDPNTPGNAAMRQMVKKIVGSEVTIPSDAHFGDAVNLLDQNQNVFTDAQLVRLARILKLDTSPPSSTATAERTQEDATASDRPTPGWEEHFGAE